MKNRFYVTTPIYYPTAKPHLGSLYSTLLADVTARWNKLQGKETFFLTGTDEHGQKIAQAAQNVGKMPKEFVDSFIENYKAVWKAYGIEYSRFIRTTEPEHIKAVQYWLSELIKKGDIYKDFYEGWYCIPDETFITEKELASSDAPLCPSCGRPTVKIKEESYFFRLSKYQDKLLNFYKEHPDFVTPKERLHEVINFVEAGLKDLSISRTTIKWGVPFPNDPGHVVYVWADALNNYITAIGYPYDMKNFEFWWPADLQIMGKDILRFHAIYWPAFLMASGLQLPKKLLAHGWIKVDDRKMSKSFGNVIDPQELLKIYGADQVRYYLVSQLSITQDANFSTKDLEDKINADLADNLGNLLNRAVQLALKYEVTHIDEIKNWDIDSQDLVNESKLTIKEFCELMDSYSLHLAVARVMHFVSKVNAYFHSREPWKIAKSDKNKFLETISAVLHSLETIAVLLWPIMPKKMEQLLADLSLDKNLDFKKNNIKNILDSNWNKMFKLIKPTEILFAKIESDEKPLNGVKDIGDVEKKEKLSVPEKEELPTPFAPKERSDLRGTSEISIDDFAKVELLVGTILECEEVPGSDKLLKLQVDFGAHGKRQILSGVKKSFSLADLMGKQAVFVFNLKPRKMMGLDSQGMMLTVEGNDGKLVMVTVENDVKPGTKLK